MRGRLVALLLGALTAMVGMPALAQEQSEPFAEDLAFPTNFAFAPDGSVYFTEKETGLVRSIAPDGALSPEAVVQLHALSGGETGLLGIALHPAFPATPWVYAYVTDPPSGMNRLVRFDVQDPEATVEILLETVPGTNTYHNGGDLLFGPDGMLYVTVGEAHEGTRAQDTSDLGGKVLRLTPEGEPAPGNPFGNEIFALGLRNSFGICADPATDDLWLTENGPRQDDEVNRVESGGNYGWPEVTGDSGGRFIDPLTVFEVPVALTGCAWWRGELYVGSFADGVVRRIDTATGSREDVAILPSGVTDLQVGPGDRLYVSTADAIHVLDEGVASSALAPTPAPEPGDAGRRRTGWVAIAAAVVLAVALALRASATRRSRAVSREDA